MKINLYKVFDDDNVINKKKELKYEIEMELKQKTNITQPVVVLGESEGIDLKSVNYAYLPEFERYYFIRSVNAGPNNVYELLLDCDVIETYKEEVLASEAEITRGIKKDDYSEISASSEVRKDVDVFTSDKGLKNESSIIFSTIGQDIIDN